MRKIFSLLLIYVVISTMLLITISNAYNVKIKAINISEDLYKIIPSKDYILQDYKIISHNKVVVFYQEKDEESKDFNKNFVAVIDVDNKKLLKNLKTNYARYKDSIVDKNGNIFIFSWRPVDIYLLTKDYKISKIYDNKFEEGKEKYIFTLDSKFTRSIDGEIFATADLKSSSNFADDVVICKLEVKDDKLTLLPYFSSYSISKFLNNNPYLMMLNYPTNIFVQDLKEKKLYNIENIDPYSKTESKEKIKSLAKEYNFKSSTLLDITKDKLLISKVDNNKNNLVVISYDSKLEIPINVEKFINAKFLNEKEVILNALENKKINFYIFHIEDKKLNKLDTQDIKALNISVLNSKNFITFNKNDIYVVTLER